MRRAGMQTRDSPVRSVAALRGCARFAPEFSQLAKKSGPETRTTLSPDIRTTKRFMKQPERFRNVQRGSLPGIIAMTHMPPVPNAATTPYPLHPAPIPEAQKQAAAAAEAAAVLFAESEVAAELRRKRTATAVGLGLGTVLLAGAARWGLRHARRKPAVHSGLRSLGDDKTKRGGQDRARVAAEQPYEVSYFARKHRISAAEARAIIKEAGPDRQAANKLARSRK